MVTTPIFCWVSLIPAKAGPGPDPLGLTSEGEVKLPGVKSHSVPYLMTSCCCMAAEVLFPAGCYLVGKLGVLSASAREGTISSLFSLTNVT